MRTRAERRKSHFNHIRRKKNLEKEIANRKTSERNKNNQSLSDKKKIDRMKYNVHLMYENEDYSDIDTVDYTTYVSEENIISHDANI